VTDPSIPTFSLTAAEIARWREECAEVDQAVERLYQKKAQIEERLRAAELLAPSLFLLAQPPQARGRGQSKVRKGLLTWPHLIEEGVRNSGQGIRQKELLDQLRAGPYGQRLVESESGYYNAIQKVLRRKQIIKRGDWLFTPAQYDQYMDRLGKGEVQDVAEEADYGSPAAAEAVRFISARPGSKSIDVIKAIWEAHSEPNPPSKTSLYNMLARLVEQRKVRKDDQGRFYPAQMTEAPEALPSEASAAGEVGASPDDAQPSLRLVR
jgi:hypothetical protein